MDTANKEFFNMLEESGIIIPPELKEQIVFRLSELINYEPRIGIFGKTGVGKSSLCNALFGADICEISDVEACTRNVKEVIVNMGSKGVKLIDAPGVGESSVRDEEYGRLYAKLLPELDLVLWLIKSDDRALASDENFYKNIVKPHIDEGKPFFFVLNQVDKIEPFRDWNEAKHEPGPKQFQNIHRKVDDVARIFDVASSKVIPISANENYNLTRLVDEFIRALPREKKVTVFKAVNKEFQSKATGESVKESFLEVVRDIVCAGIEKLGDVVAGAFDKVSDVISSAGDWIISRIPFGGHVGCYITTAVCKSDNKSDDCYELQTFRSFRDNWLSKQPGGNRLIERYYRLAPQIVKLIDDSDDSEAVYDYIKERYLKPCLKYIENDEMIECRDLYVEMVNNLASWYLLWV